MRLLSSVADFVSTSTVTESPGSSTLRVCGPVSIRMRTGTRCTIFVKLPVAFSGGKSANCAPVPGEKLDDAVQVRALERVDVQRRRLADTHAAHLRFLEVRFEIDGLHRHDRHEARARLHVLADAHGAVPTRPASGL